MAENTETIANVIDRARGWVTNGGPTVYDFAEAEHELSKALKMVQDRLTAARSSDLPEPRPASHLPKMAQGDAPWSGRRILNS